MNHPTDLHGTVCMGLNHLDNQKKCLYQTGAIQQS